MAEVFAQNMYASSCVLNHPQMACAVRVAYMLCEGLHWAATEQRQEKAVHDRHRLYSFLFFVFLN
jgi:hypothetical protein